MDTIKGAFSRGNDDAAADEEEGFLAEVRKKTKLSYKQRLIGFGICFGIACLGAFLGVLFAAFSGGANTALLALFGIFFCISTIAAVCSTFFIVGPVKQVKQMLDVVKIICVIVFIIAFILTLCAAFWWTYVSGLAILFGIIQFVAIGVYAVTLIPYATTLIKTGVTKLTSLATSS